MSDQSRHPIIPVQWRDWPTETNRSVIYDSIQFTRDFREHLIATLLELNNEKFDATIKKLNDKLTFYRGYSRIESYADKSYLENEMNEETNKLEIQNLFETFYSSIESCIGLHQVATPAGKVWLSHALINTKGAGIICEIDRCFKILLESAYEKKIIIFEGNIYEDPSYITASLEDVIMNPYITFSTCSCLYSSEYNISGRKKLATEVNQTYERNYAQNLIEVWKKCPNIDGIHYVKYGDNISYVPACVKNGTKAVFYCSSVWSGDDDERIKSDRYNHTLCVILFKDIDAEPVSIKETLDGDSKKKHEFQLYTRGSNYDDIGGFTIDNFIMADTEKLCKGLILGDDFVNVVRQKEVERRHAVNSLGSCTIVALHLMINMLHIFNDSGFEKSNPVNMKFTNIVERRLKRKKKSQKTDETVYMEDEYTVRVTLTKKDMGLLKVYDKYDENNVYGSVYDKWIELERTMGVIYKAKEELIGESDPVLKVKNEKKLNDLIKRTNTKISSGYKLNGKLRNGDLLFFIHGTKWNRAYKWTPKYLENELKINPNRKFMCLFRNIYPAAYGYMVKELNIFEDKNYNNLENIRIYDTFEFLIEMLLNKKYLNIGDPDRVHKLRFKYFKKKLPRRTKQKTARKSLSGITRRFADLDLDEVSTNLFETEAVKIQLMEDLPNYIGFLKLTRPWVKFVKTFVSDLTVSQVEDIIGEASRRIIRTYKIPGAKMNVQTLKAMLKNIKREYFDLPKKPKPPNRYLDKFQINLRF